MLAGAAEKLAGAMSAAGGRKATSGSSPDAKKLKQDTSGADVQEQFDALGDDVPGMIKMLFKQVSGVASKIDGVSVTADQAKMTANQAMAVAEAAEAKAARVEQQIKEVRVELDSMKSAEVKTATEQNQQLETTVQDLVQKSLSQSGPGVDLGPAPRVRVGRAAASSYFVHEKVIVQNFYDHKTGKGALDPKQRDALVTQLLGNIPTHIKEGFQYEKRYNLSRRIVFVLPKGGEKCWEFRTSLVETIEANNITVNGKPLKVRVQDSPEKESKRGMFWKAVFALETQVDKDKIILEPRSFSIHASDGHEKLGKAEADAYEWDDEKVKRIFPAVDLPELRRATSSRA